MTTKNAARALIHLALENPEFRTALMAEVSKESSFHLNHRDFAVEEFSQHYLLRHLREGDLVDIQYQPNDLDTHPQRIVTRLVISDFDPMLPGVELKGTEESREMLVDRGEGQPLSWEPSGQYPAYVVTKLKVVHSRLASEQKKQASRTVLAQLGGAERLAKMVGARNIQELDNGLSFEWPNRQASKGNKVVITSNLPENADYTMSFFRKDANGEEKVHTVIVPARGLTDAFEKHTGWFLRI